MKTKVSIQTKDKISINKDKNFIALNKVSVNNSTKKRVFTTTFEE